MTASRVAGDLSLKYVTTLVTRGTAPDYSEDGQVRVVGQAANQWDGIDWSNSRLHDHSGPASSLKGYLRPHDVLVNSTGTGTLGRVGYFTGSPDGMECIADGHVTVIRVDPRHMDSRYLYYQLSSQQFYDYIYSALVVGATNQIELSREKLMGAPIRAPALDEQRRIANFLDTEIAKIGRFLSLREKQRELLDERLKQLVDGSTAGDVEVLSAISCASDTRDWESSKLSRLCTIIPGFAFSSEDYVEVDAGIRLLRGVNVAVGRIDWSDVAAWDNVTHPVHDKFKLRRGDLVLGMDRPWIKEGMRLALVEEQDLPALLLQRVACLRPRAGVDMRYVQLILRSVHFRDSIESELTGVSVPHLSGEQIGRFRTKVPPLRTQYSIADALMSQIQYTDRLKETLSRQVGLLAERRQALITAAVTRQFDVTTGRSVDLS